MTNVTDVLAAQAAAVRPTADLADVHRRVRRQRRRSRTTRATVVVLLLAIGLTVAGARRRSSQGSALVNPPEVDIESVGALVLPEADGIVLPPNGTVERIDPSAPSSPRSIILRRPGGHLGDGSIVITAGHDPSSTDPSAGLPTPVSPVTTYDRPHGSISISAAGVPEADIAAIASHTDLIDGAPVVRPTGGLRSYAVASAASNRPPIIREARYGCDAVGEPTLAGLCYTGLATSAGFEDAIYMIGFQPGPPVRGMPTVLSVVGGGSATLAWEPTPGVIAYVGYSGVERAENAGPALARLAERAMIVSSTEWQASNPQRSDQNNNWR